MGTATIMKMYDDLSSKLGKESIENLILLIEQKVNTGMENNLKMMATKEDLHKVFMATKEDLHKVLMATKQDLNATKEELKTDIANVKTEVSHIKFELLKWVIGLWITNSLMILGLYLRK